MSRSPAYKKFTLSTYDIKRINASPFVLLAARPGLTHVVHGALIVLRFKSAAYANNGNLAIYETDATGMRLTSAAPLSEFLAMTADTMIELAGAHAFDGGLTRGDNKAIVISAPDGETITGDSPVDVHLWYSTVRNGL